MTQHDDRVYLGQMLDSAREALTYVDGIDFADFAGDQMRQRAVIYVIQVIGEAARRVSADRRRSTSIAARYSMAKGHQHEAQTRPRLH